MTFFVVKSHGGGGAAASRILLPLLVLAVFKAAALSSTLSERLSLGRHYPDVPHIPHTHRFLSGLFLLQAPLLWKGTLSPLPSCGHRAWHPWHRLWQLFVLCAVTHQGPHISYAYFDLCIVSVGE